MTSLQEFSIKWKSILEASDLPQPLKAIVEFVKSETEGETKDDHR